MGLFKILTLPLAAYLALGELRDDEQQKKIRALKAKVNAFYDTLSTEEAHILCCSSAQTLKHKCNAFVEKLSKEEHDLLADVEDVIYRERNHAVLL